LIFWHASAIVPLLLVDDASDEMQGVLRGDNDMMVWWGSPVEVLSALARAERSHAVASADADVARRALRGLADRWNEVQPSDEVRERAGTVLLRHLLRAADALQLAAALTWARGRPPGHSFLTLDARTAEAARREGFDLIAPTRG
jgi:predicted nucleic acid-binding protein